MVRCSRWAFPAVLLACVGCDQASKHVASLLLPGSSPVALLGGAVRLELVANPGAFLSLGAGVPELARRVVLVGLVPFLLALVCGIASRSARRSRCALVALGLIAGGGLGNWLDRVLHDGAVRDFVSVGLGPLRTGIFNLADVAILGGLALLLLSGRSAPRGSAGEPS